MSIQSGKMPRHGGGGRSKDYEPLISSKMKMTIGSLSAVGENGIAPLETESVAPNAKNQLGTINGVYIPCLLNILGAVLFMRVGYVVGYAGWLGTIALFGFSNIVAVLTAFSFSAIVTNGKMGGGGVYYMISRSMGPAFGGATGLLFYTCYVLNSAFNATAMVEDLITSFFPHSPAYVFNILYHGVLFVLLLVALAGADAFAKLNFALFVTLIAAILVVLASLLVMEPHHVAEITADRCYDLDPSLNYSDTSVDLYRPSMARFRENMHPDWSDDNPLVVVLALVYTTTCGIMVGANLSGDLKDPGKSLPVGTLSAMATSFATYVIFASVLAATFDRRALQCDYLVLQKAAVSSVFVIVGVAMATLSTALGALFGAARIFQAIARDNLVPIGYFAKGTKNGDEPIRAVVLTWLLVNACGYIGGGSVQGIAQILTDFFLTACAFVNLSQCLLSLANAPNYRPSFKYATWWSSLIGFLLAIALMWFLNVQHAAMTCGLWTVIFVYIKLTCAEKPWGDVGQAIMFRQVVARLRGLLQRRDHAKFWRSSILLLAQDGDHPLLTLCKHFTKDSLFMVGVAQLDVAARPMSPELYERPRTISRRFTQSMLPNHQSMPAVTKAAWLWLIEHAKVNGFVNVGVGVDLVQIYRNMIACAGLGALVPNTVLIPYEDGRTTTTPDFVTRLNEQLETDACKTDKDGIKRCCKHGRSCGICNDPTSHNSSAGLHDPVMYCRLIQATLALEKNVMVVRNSAGLDTVFQKMRDGRPIGPTTIDLWIVGDWTWASMEQNIALLLQHAHLMQQAFGKKCKVRIIQLVQYFFSEEQYKLKKGLNDIVLAARIKMPELLVLPAPAPAPSPRSPTPMPGDMGAAGKTLEYYRGLNEMVREYSFLQETELAFMALPKLPEHVTKESANVYVGCLNALTSGLPPLVMIEKGEKVPVISYDV